MFIVKYFLYQVFCDFVVVSISNDQTAEEVLLAVWQDHLGDLEAIINNSSVAVAGVGSDGPDYDTDLLPSSLLLSYLDIQEVFVPADPS